MSGATVTWAATYPDFAMSKPDGYIDVDRLQAEVSLEQAAAMCGVSLDVRGTGPEVRIDCPFQCPGDHAGRKEVAVNIFGVVPLMGAATGCGPVWCGRGVVADEGSRGRRGFACVGHVSASRR